MLRLEGAWPVNLSLWGAVLGLALTGLARGQALLPSFIGLWHPVLGAGAAYAVQDRQHQVERLEVAVVGQEGSDYWVEVAYHGLDERLVRQLVGPQGARRVLTHEGQDTRELAPGCWQGGGLPVDIAQLGVPLGTESVAGHSCQKYQLQGESALVWIDPTVSPYGLVRLQSREFTLELVEVLQGQQSRFPRGGAR